MMSRRSIENPRLQEAVRRLVRDLRPRAVILFGSWARGTPRADSDYDLLVISDQIRDYDEVYRPIVGCGLPCDVVPCSVDAWKDADKDSGGVLREARDEGVILYGQP